MILATPFVSWRRRIPRIGQAACGHYSSDAAVVAPQPRRPLNRLVLYAVIIAITLVAAPMLANAQSDCVTKWNAVLYRPDDITAFSMCVRGETIPVR